MMKFRHRGHLLRPRQFFLIASLILTGVFIVLLMWSGLSLVVAYLVGVNAVTFIYYGYDKFQAGRQGQRVPEIVLHLLAGAGGTPGALTGQLLFRHKTQARRFRMIFFVILVAQAALVLAYVSGIWSD